MDKYLKVRIPIEVHDALKFRAVRQRTTVQDLVSQALQTLVGAPPHLVEPQPARLGNIGGELQPHVRETAPRNEQEPVCKCDHGESQHRLMTSEDGPTRGPCRRCVCPQFRLAQQL